MPLIRSRVSRSGNAAQAPSASAGSRSGSGRQTSTPGCASRRCASRSELFEALHLEVSRTPPDLTIGFEQPTHLFSRTRGSLARIDVVVEVPESIAVLVEGEMGPVEVSDVGSLRLDRSLGDVRVVNVDGDVTLTTGVAPEDQYAAVLLNGTPRETAFDRVGMFLGADGVGVLKAFAGVNSNDGVLIKAGGGLPQITVYDSTQTEVMDMVERARP